MSKITVVADAMVIKSEVSLESLKLVEKMRPEALALMGGKDNKEEVFRIGTGTTGSVNSFSATFSGESRDEAKKATITLDIKGIDKDVKEYIADKYGKALANINAIEANLGAVVEEIKTAKKAVMDAIEIK